MFHYCITIRKTQFPNFIHYYEDFEKAFTEKYSKIILYYEGHFEPEAGLHYHAIFKSSKSVHINQLHQFLGKGYNLRFELTRSISDWTSYIKKSRTETSLINSEHAIEKSFDCANNQHQRFSKSANAQAFATLFDK